MSDCGHNRIEAGELNNFSMQDARISTLYPGQPVVSVAILPLPRKAPASRQQNC